MPEIDIYAVVGNPALHSRSPQMFRRAFEAEGIPATYTRLAADSAAEAMEVARAIGLKGLNVTSPFKEEMLIFIDEMDETAERIGAINTILFDGGRSRGFNLDGDGVVAMCAKAGFRPRGARAAVLGAGGAAKAAANALMWQGANVVMVNRSAERGEQAAKSLGVRFVPLGDAAAELKKAQAVFACWPRSAEHFDHSLLNRGQILFDANYGDSIFAKAARRAGCRYISGEEWLIGQALTVFSLFTGSAVPDETMRGALEEISEKGHVILSGMMGTGKSLVAGELADQLGLEPVDTDATVERMSGKSILEIFETYGEAEFRRLEAVAVEEALGNARSVIALGGGALTNDELAKLAGERGDVVWLWASPKVCAERASNGLRPLLAGNDPEDALRGILKERLASYASSSDLIVSTERRDPKEIAEKIFDEIDKSGKN